MPRREGKTKGTLLKNCRTTAKKTSEAAHEIMVARSEDVQFEAFMQMQRYLDCCERLLADKMAYAEYVYNRLEKGSCSS